MRLLAPARRAMESTRAPSRPALENSPIAACRICSRVRSGARRARGTERPGASAPAEPILGEFWPADGEDAGGIVVWLASAMDHPDEGKEIGEAGGAQRADEGGVAVGNVQADRAVGLGQRRGDEGLGGGLVLGHHRADLVA